MNGSPTAVATDAGGIPDLVPDGVETYRAYRHRWDAGGEGEPAALARRHGGRTTVYASWNGATGVARWRVNAAGVRPVSVPRTGFETILTGVEKLVHACYAGISGGR